MKHEVWSSTKGANRVLQNAWENRKPGEKIMFIFSITHRYVVSPLLKRTSLIIQAATVSGESTVVWRKCRDHSIQKGKSIVGQRDFKAMKE